MREMCASKSILVTFTFDWIKNRHGPASSPLLSLFALSDSSSSNSISSFVSYDSDARLSSHSDDKTLSSEFSKKL